MGYQDLTISRLQVCRGPHLSKYRRVTEGEIAECQHDCSVPCKEIKLVLGTGTENDLTYYRIEIWTVPPNTTTLHVREDFCSDVWFLSP
jgi:hypothetical protein